MRKPVFAVMLARVPLVSRIDLDRFTQIPPEATPTVRRSGPKYNASAYAAQGGWRLESVPDSPASLYDRMGGAQAVAEMASRFYSKMIADPNLRPFFDHAVLGSLKDMQAEFFSATLDGPTRYPGRPVAYAHQEPGIFDRLFVSVNDLLRSNDSVESHYLYCRKIGGRPRSCDTGKHRCSAWQVR